MHTYERATRVEAPLSEVVDFHSAADGLVALTPSIADLRIESVTGPDGEPDPAVLEAGATIVASVSPLGLLPRKTWTSEIVSRDVGEEAAGFTDVMVDGPFPHWRHTHRFFADDGATVVYDHVEYELPGGPVGAALGHFGFVGFEPMFRYRHRRTKAILEDR